jgi:AsmA protein
MRKLIKIFLSLIVVLIICAVTLPFLLPLDTYKQEIAAQVKNATGRDLVIGGAMSARLFPAIGITVENASLSNPEGFSEKQMLQVEKLALEVELMPLFSKQIRVKRFVLEKPVINLEVNAAGIPNWQFSSPQAPAASEAAQETSGKKADTLLAGLVLGDIKISDGKISYRDQQTKKSYALSDVNLKTAFAGLSSPFKADADAVWNNEKAAITFALERPDAFTLVKSSPFAMTIKSAPVTFEYKGSVGLTGTSGDAAISIPSLPKLAAWTGGAFEWKGATPLAFSAKGTLSCNPSACSFAKSDIALDDIKARGDFLFGLSGKPSIEATLALDALDINPYVPKKHADNNWFISPAYAMEPWSNEKIDLSSMRMVNANINITTGSLLYNKIKIGKTSLALKLQNGALTASMPKAEFYGGSISGNSTLDASGAFTKQITISGVQAEPFLKDAMDSDRFSGTMNMSATINGTLTSIRDMVESLNGSGNVKLTDGAVKGVDLAGMIRNVQSAFKNIDTSQQKTDFSELGGTFTIARGIVSNSDLAMKAPLLRLSGKGTVDLPQQMINYRLTPEIVQTIQGQGGKEKQGLEVPIIVSGPLDHPNFVPDLAGMAQKALENPEAIKETVKDLKQQFKENKGDLKGLLKGLGGR